MFECGTEQNKADRTRSLVRQLDHSMSARRGRRCLNDSTYRETSRVLVELHAPQRCCFTSRSSPWTCTNLTVDGWWSGASGGGTDLFSVRRIRSNSALRSKKLYARTTHDQILKHQTDPHDDKKINEGCPSGRFSTIMAQVRNHPPTPPPPSHTIPSPNAPVTPHHIESDQVPRHPQLLHPKPHPPPHYRSPPLLPPPPPDSPHALPHTLRPPLHPAYPHTNLPRDPGPAHLHRRRPSPQIRTGSRREGVDGVHVGCGVLGVDQSRDCGVVWRSGVVGVGGGTGVHGVEGGEHGGRGERDAEWGWGCGWGRGRREWGAE